MNQNTNDFIIEVSHLCKTFGNKSALNKLSFGVKKGEIFGFLGPSGSGKTTTIKILTSQLHPTEGDVTIFGKPILHHQPSQLMKQIGIVTDNSGLYERLSIEDNLKLFAKLFDVDLKKIDERLQLVNLLQDKKTIVKNLSKGMKQRVILARAMLHQPSILFLDEPTAALDPVNVQEVHKQLRELNEQGTTIFLTTHNMEEAESLCDRIAFLNDGKISAFDTPEKLRLQYSDQTVTLYLESGEKQVLPLDESSASTIHDHLKEGKIKAIHSNEPTLGDIFVQLTGRELS